MKKTLAIVLSFIMMIGFVPAYSFGVDIVDAGECGEHLTYSLDAEGTLTIEGYGPMWDFGTEEHQYRPWDIYTPPVYDENGIEEESERADIRIIKRIILPEGLTSIGNGAFEFFMGNEIELPEHLERIGNSAFACSYLKSLDIPNSVLEIGEAAFNGCAQLKQVNLSENLTEISDYLFFYSGVEKITLPNQVVHIGEYAFGNCVWLSEIDLSPALQTIGADAFMGTRLDHITIPQSCSELGANCFDPFSFHCYYPLESIVILNDNLKLENLGIETFSFAWTEEKVRQYDSILNNVWILKLNSTAIDQVAFPLSIADHISQLQTYANLFIKTEWQSIEEYNENMPVYQANAIKKLNSMLGTYFETRDEVIDVDTLEATETFESALKNYFGSTQPIYGFTYPWFTIYGHGGATSEAYANSIGATFVCLHEDNDENGYCDFCGKNLNGPDEPVDPGNEQTGEKCKYCDEVHGNDFMGRLTKFFHSILYFFAHLFGRA